MGEAFKLNKQLSQLYLVFNSEHLFLTLFFKFVFGVIKKTT